MRISIFFINLQKLTARVDHIHSEPIRLDLRLSPEVAVDGKGLTFKMLLAFIIHLRACIRCQRKK